MFALKLYLAIESDPSLESDLAKANPHLVSLFLGGGDYLARISLSESPFSYIVKPVSLSTTVNELENIEAHFLSLLRKLIPRYPTSKNPPRLITTLDDNFCFPGGGATPTRQTARPALP